MSEVVGWGAVRASAREHEQDNRDFILGDIVRRDVAFVSKGAKGSDSPA
jgi:hypothetical protein